MDGSPTESRADAVVWWAAALAACVLPVPAWFALSGLIDLVAVLGRGGSLRALFDPVLRGAPLVMGLSAALVVGAVVGLSEPRRGPPGTSVIVGGLAGLPLGVLVGSGTLAMLVLHEASAADLLSTVERVVRQDGPFVGAYAACFTVLGVIAGLLRPAPDATRERRVGTLVMMLIASCLFVVAQLVAILVVVVLFG